MTSEVVLLISILCLVKCTWCGNYDFGLGTRQSNDEILHQELLTSNADSNEAVIEYIYKAEKPVSYMQLSSNTNINTEVTFFNSNKIFIKLSNFEHMDFNATLTVYGFPWHPDGPEPDIEKVLLQPNPRKAMYLNKSSVEDSSIIATNGAYMSKEISKSKTKEDSNWAGETEETEESQESDSSSDTSEYYDYDNTSTNEKNIPEVGEVDSIVDAVQNFEGMNQSVATKCNFLIFVTISCLATFIL